MLNLWAKMNSIAHFYPKTFTKHSGNNIAKGTVMAAIGYELGFKVNETPKYLLRGRVMAYLLWGFGRIITVL